MGIPVELALLPFVESEFDPYAQSVYGATGIWQFLPATGREWGLKSNWWYDGKRDVIASINFINQSNKSRYFIKDRLFTIDESNYINFFIVDDMLKSGNIPPKSYLYDRIKATIINQRKLDILKSINKEILNDAIKSRKYEVYK